MTTAEPIYKYEGLNYGWSWWELDIKLLNLSSAIVIWSMTTVKRPQLNRVIAIPDGIPVKFVGETICN